MPRSTNVPPDTSSAIPPRGQVFAETEKQKRLRRLRAVAWFLDRSIPIGGGWRVGVDPLLGLLPGAGDWVGAMLSLYVLYEAARLGLPRRVLGQMAGNILVETIAGTVPVLGDLFDFAWQANMRNVALIDRHYRPEQTPRSFRRIAVALAAFALVIAGLTGTLLYLAFKGLEALLS